MTTQNYFSYIPKVEFRQIINAKKTDVIMIGALDDKTSSCKSFNPAHNKQRKLKIFEAQKESNK